MEFRRPYRDPSSEKKTQGDATIAAGGETRPLAAAQCHKHTLSAVDFGTLTLE